jgi:hypothetical protein
LSHFPIPFSVLDIFRIGSHELFAWLTWNLDPPDLCAPSS